MRRGMMQSMRRMTQMIRRETMHADDRSQRQQGGSPFLHSYLSFIVIFVSSMKEYIYSYVYIVQSSTSVKDSKTSMPTQCQQ
jgi:hypothetical protein